MDRRKKIEPIICYYYIPKEVVERVTKASTDLRSLEKCMCIPTIMIPEREYWRAKYRILSLAYDEMLNKLIQFVPIDELKLFSDYSLHLNTTSRVLVVVGIPNTSMKKFAELGDDINTNNGLLN